MTSNLWQRWAADIIPFIILAGGATLGYAHHLSWLPPFMAAALLSTLFSGPRYLGLILAGVISGLGTVVSLVPAEPLISGTELIAYTVSAWLMAAAIYHAKQTSLNLRDLIQAAHTRTGNLLIATLSGKIASAGPGLAQLFAQSDAPLDEEVDLRGYTLEELFGSHAWTTLRDNIKSAEAINLEVVLATDQGSRYLACHGAACKVLFGLRHMIVLQVNDVTNEHKLHNALQSADRQMRRVLSKSSDLVVFTDAKLNITYANVNAYNALALDGKDLTGMALYHFVDIADRRLFMKAMEQFTQASRNEVHIDTLHLAEQNQTPAAVHIARLNATGDHTYAVTCSVAEHHLQALAASKASQARFAQVFHGTPDAILLLRAQDGLVLDFNEGFTRLLGYAREEAIGDAQIHERLWANFAERDRIIEQVREEREVIDYETRLKTSTGEIVNVEISLRYVEIDNELCMLCIGRDITKRISAEAALVETEEKFEKVFSQSPDGIVIVRQEDAVVTEINSAMLRHSGYQRQELVGQSLFDASLLFSADEIANIGDILISDGTITNFETTFSTKGGELVPALVSANTVELAGVSNVMLIAKDISKQRVTEERLRSSEERFRGIFENAPIGIMLVDMNGRIFQANRTAADLLAYDEQDMYGIHISRLVASEDRPNLKESLSSLTTKKENTDRAERRMLCQNGLEIWTNFHVVLQQNSEGIAQYYIVQIADISDVKRGQQRMERMAFYDTLTNLANRRLFHERLSQAIEQCERADTSSALLYLDLDNFKRVNDTLGHQVGDHLLSEVATRLQHCVRAEDTVGRTGGDEFTILLNHIASPTDAGVVAQKILNHLREPINISGHPLVVTTSIGITIIPGDGVDPNILMRNADLAMYQAKERGRNNYQFYSEDLNTNAVKRLRTEYEIRQALENNEFELYFQPKVSLATAQIVGVESLIRWNHPERGLLTPDEFIEVAEETGSIIDIGTWVMQEACRACEFLNMENPNPLQVAINISPRQFRDPNLVSTMQTSLRETKLDPHNIELEITETMLMRDVQAAEITVQRLSDLGVSLAIDDFGTGYSSLNYLKRFPINTVKVDRSFVMDLPSNPDDMAITRAVIAMAHQLKMEVVAEGVETKEQMNFLAEHDCEYAQGWLFAKALPLDAVNQLIKSNLGVIHVG